MHRYRRFGASDRIEREPLEEVSGLFVRELELLTVTAEPVVGSLPRIRLRALIDRVRRAIMDLHRYAPTLYEVLLPALSYGSIGSLGPRSDAPAPEGNPGQLLRLL
jgi:hypothetical protein